MVMKMVPYHPFVVVRQAVAVVSLAYHQLITKQALISRKSGKLRCLGGR